jgi:hypothetical protein
MRHFLRNNAEQQGVYVFFYEKDKVSKRELNPYVSLVVSSQEPRHHALIALH